MQQLSNAQPVPPAALWPPLRRRTSSSPTSTNPFGSSATRRKPVPPITPPTVRQMPELEDMSNSILPWLSSPASSSASSPVASRQRNPSFSSPNTHSASPRTPPSRSNESHILDMKRLLAKPAPLSGSDSEGRKSIDRMASLLDGRRSLGSRNYGSGGFGRGRKISLDSDIDFEMGRLTNETMLSGASAGVEPIGKDARERAKEKRPRNVLKRRPSGSRSHGGDPPTPINSATSRRANSRSRSRSRPPSPGRVPAYPMALDLNLEDKQRSPAPHSQENSPHSSHSGQRTRALTPAGAVVEAYKRQELQAERVSPGPSQLNHAFSPGKGDIRRGGQVEAKATGSQISHKSYEKEWEEQEQEPSTPYYTVFGSTSGRVVAVGGPEDSWDRYQPTSRVLSPAKPPKDGVLAMGKTLTRKVSSRWKRGGESQPSLQERRDRGGKTTTGEGDRKSLRLSLEKHLDDNEIPMTPVASNVLSDGPVRSRKSEPIGGSAGGGKVWRLMKRLSTGGLRDKYHHHDASVDLPPVPALPRDYLQLPASRSMSNDGHTSPFQHSHGTPQSSTPSPPLSSNGHGVLSRLISRSTSASVSAPSTASVHGSSPNPPRGVMKVVPASAPPPPPLIPSASSNNGPRPSTTTRSSSPVSSDVASSRFFNRTQSARSSTSSCGDEIPPPVPQYVVGQHIIPPSEFSKIHLDGNARERKANSVSGRKGRPGTSGSRSLPPEETKKSRGPSLQTRSFTSGKADDWSIVRTPQDELPSLPLPPRRLHHSAVIRASLDESHNIRSASPAIPAFSTSDAINTFGPASGKKLSPSSNLSEYHWPDSAPPATSSNPPSTLPPFTAAAPPPRPSRSAHRPSPTTSASASRVTSPARRNDRTPEAKSDSNRKSSGTYSNASTARPRRGSGSSLPPPPTTATALTFREIGSPADKQALTEKEKADRWDDLLERSARAGGTLHLGAGAPEHGLQSDMLRFSNYSETSSNRLSA